MANFCSKCGQAVASDASFCAGCGNRLEDAPPEQSQEQPAEQPSFAVPVVEVGKGRGFFKTCLIVVGAVVGGGLLLIILAGVCTAIVSDSDEASGEQVERAVEQEDAEDVPTPIPITAQRLYEEREQNATRFDDEYKGKIVRVSGVIEKVDDGRVTLRVPGSFGEVDLKGIPREDQIPLNPGRSVVAVCKVGDFIFITMNLENCELQ